jgi:hypothetical protein
MDFEKLKREEEEATKMMFGKPEEVVEETNSAVEDLDEESTFNDELTDREFESSEEITQELEVPIKTEEKKPRVSWKKRFINEKTASDATKYDLRTKNAALTNEVLSLTETIKSVQSEMRELKKQFTQELDPLEGIFSKEEEDLIGTEAADMIKKAVNARDNKVDPEVAALTKRLEKMETARLAGLKAEADKHTSDGKADLKRRLDGIVPGWSVLDEEEGFHQFIQEYDEVSGRPRSDLFANAVTMGDVVGVARFYKDYSDTKPKSREEILSRKVTPVAGGASATDGSGHDGQKPLYRVSDYNKFMDDVTKGKWRTRMKEAKIKERQYDQAYIDGRLID